MLAITIETVVSNRRKETIGNNKRTKVIECIPRRAAFRLFSDVFAISGGIRIPPMYCFLFAYSEGVFGSGNAR
ncbi:hypothetical protein HanRHA438_Chr17g0834281 [Helianthus annuus]|nr:hypothetical protein HanRHA438_Chr17g0834281 [Helianthus annuus]